VDGEYNVLVLGHDKEAKLTDVVMLVNVNNNDGKLTVMQIPRDTYFGGKGAPSASVDKVNEIFVTYYRGYLNDGESEKNAYKAALEDTKKLLSDALAVNIDFAAIMDLSGFKNIVDAIGGVTLDVPAPLQYYDEVQDLRIDIPAGRQTLDGDMAEGFVRFREGYVQADLGRINAQKLFMNAFLT
jgi:LCP family protein required for cell wall assembly